ncbi:MAG: V-type ATP synthase subunit I [Spirochaetaceae bacterium]|nr:MAG: V-type ATP synthase subunit I [Spirochaetaceae bacterium]
MIVKMKKVSIVVFDRFREQSLKALRRLGLVHIESRPVSSDTLNRFSEQKTQLERARLLLPEPGKKELKKQQKEQKRKNKALKKQQRGQIASAAAVNDEDLDGCLEIADEVVDLTEKIRLTEEQIDKLTKEQQRLDGWGGYDPEEIRELADKGIFISLYELSTEEFKRLPEELDWLVIAQNKSAVRLAVVTIGTEPALDFEAEAIGEMGRKELLQHLEGNRKELQGLRHRLQHLAGERVRIQAVLHRLDRKIEFEEVRTGMVGEGELSYLSGYVPAKRSEALKRAASENGWALLVDDPAEDDPVPTLVENPRWIRIIRPMFSLMETTPGYREFDISFIFLLFFSLFFAMLIGDAGYGIILFLLTLIARLAMLKRPGGVFSLLFVLSGATIIWGALSGTWFGVESLARHPLLSRIVVPQIASFGVQNTKTVMFLCFVIGAVHLSIARLINFFRNLPKLVAFSELGWLSILWGMFFVTRYIVLQQPLNPVGIWLIAAGIILVVVFGEQKGKFLKGVLFGMLRLPLSLLDSIGSFSNIVSYVRLFAVGLATVAVATNFNAMAAEVGFAIPSGLISAFILFFGHTLNIIMGAMSVIVHGVRLNMLEFSGQLGMEWTGVPYKPFQETEAETPDGERRNV